MFVEGSLLSIDEPYKGFLLGSASTNGIIWVADYHQTFITDSISNNGTLTLFDMTHQFASTGIITGGYYYLPGDETFSMNQVVGDATVPPRFGVWGIWGPPAPATNDSDPSITYQDWTYANWGGDTTVIDSTTVLLDGTYQIRNYDPIWVNFGIWFIAPPDRSDSTLAGYRYREPVHKNVGQYYASMQMPDQPGHYEIHWLSQKYDETAAWEARQRFTVMSNGIVPFPDYS